MKNSLFIFISLFQLILFPQENESLREVTLKFRNFEYQQVIDEADTLLKSNTDFTNPELIEIYRMKGISHYALLDDSRARISFIEILRIDSSYRMDPSNTSPKIVTFFSEVKKEYLASIKGKEEQIVITKYDTVYIPQVKRDTVTENNFKNALIRSIVIPGTGHLYLQDNLKSWVLTFLSAASIGTGIYFIIDTNKKEKIYLEERDPNEIGEKYNDYNFSYRLRNLAFISFAALWIYSQLDLLFFIEEGNPGIYSYLPKIYYDGSKGILFNYLIKF
jgi:hypothetical protein